VRFVENWHPLDVIEVGIQPYVINIMMNG